MTLSPNRLQPVAQLRLLRFKVEKLDHKSPVAISCSPVELQFFAVVATRLQNSRVTPSTAMQAERNTDMELGSANDAWQALNKKRAPIEGLGAGPGLRIPDVEVYGA